MPQPGYMDKFLQQRGAAPPLPPPQPAPQASPFAGLATNEGLTTEALISSFNTLLQRQLSLNPYEGADVSGNPLDNPEYLQAQSRLNTIGAVLSGRGINPFTGLPDPTAGGGGGGADHYATDVARQSDIEQLDFQRQEAERSQRNTESQQKINSVLDLLEGSIKRGDIDRTDADRKFQGALGAAQIESDLLQHFAGYNLPAGTSQVPGFETDSAYGRTVAALTGRPFEGYATGGTMPIDPGMHTPALTAAAGPSGASGYVGTALTNAANALGGLVPGLPQVLPATPQSPQPRVAAPAMTNAVNFLGGLGQFR
ncbi:MAG: hypothetical protein NUW01_08905 [Gemmatimonadaceae bacterium]|nr:hypothetical protein [Gemmatimonadaceae bacterium]